MRGNVSGSAPSASESSLPFARRLRGVSALCSVAIAGLSALALVGWAVGAGILERMAPGLPPVKANAAVGLLLASVGSIAYASSRSRPVSRLRWVGVACAAVVLLIGAATLLEYVFGWRLGIDQLLFRDRVARDLPYPGRPAANTAVGLVLLGSALLLWDLRLGRWWATNVLVWATAVVGLLAVTGYAVDAGWLVSFGAHQRIALNAAIALCLLPVAILLARPERGATVVLAGGGQGGVVLRRLLPVAILLPVLLAAATLAGQRRGLFSSGFAVWLFASTTTVALVAVVWRVATDAERAGVQRVQLEGMMLALAETASDSIVTVDESGRIAYGNPALARMFGYESVPLLGLPCEVLFPERDRAGQRERHERLLTTRDPDSIGHPEEVTGLRADGGEFPIEISRATWVAGGAPVVAGIIRDVSARRRAEQKLRGLLESAPDAIVVADQEGQIVVCNARAEAIFGYSREEMLGSPVELLVPDASRRAHAAMRGQWFKRPVARHVGSARHFYGRRKDGSAFPAEITLNPIETDDGVLVSSAIRDVTDRKRADELTARLAAIVNSTPNAVIGVGVAGRVEAWNAGAQDLYGYLPEQAIGQPITMLNPPERADDRAHIDAALGGKVARFESEDITRDGRRVETSVTISPIRDHSGTIIGVSCLAQDITEQKRAERTAAQLAAIVESSDDAIIGKTLEGTITSWNHGAERIYGYSAAEAIGRHVSMLTPTGHSDEPADLLTAVAAGERVSHVESIRRRKDGQLIDVSLTVSPIRNAHAEVIGASTVARDITEHRRQEIALQQAEERLRRAFDEAPIGMALTSADGVLEQANAALAAICGYTRNDLIGMQLRKLLHPGDVQTGIEGIQALAAGRTEQLALDMRIIPSAGAAVDVSVHATRLADDSETTGRLLCQFLDVTDRKRFESKLQFMADHDPLTGLLNRRKFEAELDRHVEHVKRYGPEGALLVLDLDQFKAVNDTLGHNAGDELIVSIAGLLRHRLRTSDTLARQGGDEFAVLLPKADRTEAAEVAEAIVTAIRTNTSLLGGERRKVTTSLGIAMFGADDQPSSGESILIAADLAMYDAKDAGRDQYAFYETSEHRTSRTKAHLTWSNRIDKALTDDRFVLVAQPILDLRTDRISQYELLIRMLDEHGDLIPPAAFLYIAERVGSISKIDEWVASRAIDLIELHPQLHLEVNISGKSLGDPTLLRTIDDRLRATTGDPTHLIFEVTETAAVANVTHAQTFAQHLRDHGCRFALDDFGAGFGSFYYLKHLPFDYVKIDGEFVKNATAGRIDQLVIEAVVNLARGLGKETIAEFVTNEDTKRMIRGLGVDYAQGYHISSPIPLPEILVSHQQTHLQDLPGPAPI